MTSTRTENRENKRAILMQAAFHCLSAAQMEKRFIEQLEMWKLREFFKWLHENPRIREIVEKNFYSVSKKKSLSLLPQDDNIREEEDFN